MRTVSPVLKHGISSLHPLHPSLIQTKFGVKDFAELKCQNFSKDVAIFAEQAPFLKAFYHLLLKQSYPAEE
ncbi:MAG: hypothetical protein SAK29_33285, partial [Scytonema sp. PMC 1069.18]|nr:hypothetical protein [Scytonema sp. PMC 1069.18]